MDVGSAGAAGSAGVLVELLRTAQRSQADMAQALLAVNVENKIHADKMAIAQQIIDVYA